MLEKKWKELQERFLALKMEDANLKQLEKRFQALKKEDANLKDVNDLAVRRKTLQAKDKILSANFDTHNGKRKAFNEKLRNFPQKKR